MINTYNLIELSAIKLLTTFTFTKDSKEFFKQKLNLDIQHVICQVVLNKRPDLVDKLEHFFDPETSQTPSIKKVANSYNLPAVKILKIFLATFPNLTKLDLSGTEIEQLEAFNQLEELNFSGFSCLNPEVFLTLKDKYPKLTKLNLSGRNVKQLEAPHQLEELNLSRCERLSLKAFLTIREKFPRLKKLNISHLSGEIAWEPANLESLVGLPLEELHLAKWDLSLENMLMINNQFPQLKKLTLDEKGRDILSALVSSQLEELSIDVKKDLDNDLTIIKQNIPFLKKFHISRPFGAKSDMSFRELMGLSLEELHLDQCRQLPAPEFLTIQKGFPYLKKLSLPMTSIDSLKGLAGLPLEELDLQSCKKLPAVEFLTINESLPCLKKLNLWDTHIDSLEGLVGLPLEELCLSYCKKLPAAEFLTINKKLPYLKKLYLVCTHIDSLEGLVGLPLLKELIIIDCSFLSEDKILHFKHTHPWIAILVAMNKWLSNGD